jgi:Icc-related predicted phosphoesterase
MEFSAASPAARDGRGGLTLVCISDSHSKHQQIRLPMGDVLIHAGDFSNTGTLNEIKSFTQWFDSQPHPSKIFIAGNHDTSIDTSYYVDRGAKRFHRFQVNQMTTEEIKSYSESAREVIQNAHSVYLEDSEYELLSSVEPNSDHIHSFKVYGSPWQPEFCDWAFNVNRGPEIKRYWDKIPVDTDILITHGPPLGFGDLTSDGFHCGCSDLLDRVLAHPPRVHIFGHIHEAYGKILSS